MTPEEAERLSALHEKAMRGAGNAWTAADFLAFAESPGAMILTRENALLAGRVAGPEAEIAALAVHPDARRQGLARALIADFLAAAFEAGAQEAFLEVAESARAARALYRATGWREAGLRRAYYRRADGRREDALVLARGAFNGDENT